MREGNQMNRYEVEIAVSEIKTGRFMGLYLVEVEAESSPKAVEAGIVATDPLFKVGFKLECNGVTKR